jgi:hypothetical protein
MSTQAMRAIKPSDLKKPTDYKARYEAEQHRRQNLEARVEALELERDALRYRNSQLKAQLEQRLGLPHVQAQLSVQA